ncbi:MAG TPA: DNA polymerase III subunit alpha [Firmicutes bacterium]|nr:DNA polymerase III subunit alpha [Bacillota bacterium]
MTEIRRFGHLHVHSPFSFLDGATRIGELASIAASMGIAALGLTDHDNLSGAVKFKEALNEVGVKPIIGAELTMEGGHHLVLLCEHRKGYANLCKIMTRAHLENERLKPCARFRAIVENSEGLILLSGCRRGEIAEALLSRNWKRARDIASMYKRAFPGRFFLELSEWLLPGSRTLNGLLWQLGEELGIPVVATNDVHYGNKEDFKVHDILTCIRTDTRLEDVAPERPLNAENYLKSPGQMERLLAESLGRAACERIMANTWSLVERCSEDVLPSALSFPAFETGSSESSESMLRRLTYDGAVSRYGKISSTVKARIDHELEIISKLGYADYFLTVWDLVKFAQSSGIRYAGRGSAADSAVAYCIGITEVDSIARGLLFERFLSLERAQKPDIDIDFDARFRDKIFEYVRRKYGDERVGWVCTYNTFQVRSAVREIGKAIGFQEEELDNLAKCLPHIPADCLEEAITKFPELRALRLPMDKFKLLFEMCGRLAGFPRFLGTHLGGIVLSGSPLTDITPLQMAAKGVKIAQFDKDDVEALGLIKIDLLSLKMLSAIEDAVRAGGIDYDAIPLNDETTFKMIREGETVGVFQLESPAQRALQRRLNADHFEDIVASVALIRPGPVKGNMVDPFVARRNGREPVTVLDPRLENILEKTYGVVLFQEQVIEIATVIGGFTPGEADKLRRVMTHGRSREEMDKIGEIFISKAIRNGTSPEVAKKIFECIKEYASYGFCEAHAAAFATTAIKSAYLANHYPAQYYAALLSNQPMGYYPPSVLVLEAKRRGIQVLPPCVNRSGLSFSVEGVQIRSSLMVRDMDKAIAQRILQERSKRPFSSFEDFLHRVKPPRDAVLSLICAGTFDQWNTNRRALLWKACGGEGKDIEEFSLGEKLAYEYRSLGFTISGHPMMLWREKLNRSGVRNSSELGYLAPGAAVTVAGFPVRPHRPPTKSGRITTFMSLEDEFGLVDVTIFEDVYQKYGCFIFGKCLSPLWVSGILSKRGKSPGLIAKHLGPLPSYHPARVF